MKIFRAWQERRERDRLKRWPRYTPTMSMFRGRQVTIVDAATYREGLREIFAEGIYEFRSSQAQPLILDCGSNIGLSVLYFKSRYPGARIVAFEPDPLIFKALQSNVAAFGLERVALHQAAVWIENGTVEFKEEGGFSGRIHPGAAGTVQVPTVRLRDLLGEKVEFLKMDIEGAEVEVLGDCAGNLGRVERMFVEYHSECGHPQRLDELLAIIRGAGFRYQVKEAYVAAKPFLRRPAMMSMDLQLNVFCFRDATP